MRTHRQKDFLTFYVDGTPISCFNDQVAIVTVSDLAERVMMQCVIAAIWFLRNGCPAVQMPIALNGCSSWFELRNEGIGEKNRIRFMFKKMALQNGGYEESFELDFTGNGVLNVQRKKTPRKK